MTPTVEWLGESESHGVRQRRFDLDRGSSTGTTSSDGGTGSTGSDGDRGTTSSNSIVPGLLWTPIGAVGPRPLVLLGHGASGNKGQDYVLAMARRLVRHRNFAVASIDGPIHGDRRARMVPPPVSNGSNAVFLEFAARWSSDLSMTDEMVADYIATLDALQAVPEVGAGPVGFWGLSMGTIFGLPFVAAEPRIRAAVLGLMGITGPTRDRIERDAPNVQCSVLFLVQWDDELFSRVAAFSLFDALGSVDKRLHASTGSHGAVPEEEMGESEGFLGRCLGEATVLGTPNLETVPPAAGRS